VLEGGRATLARARPIVIFEHVIEVSQLHGATPEAPWDLLTELDYEIFSVMGEGPFTRTEFARAIKIVDWLAKPAR
jgi:hypothetical protein